MIRLHPDSLDNIPKAQDVFASVTPNTIKGQVGIGGDWMVTTWKGACDALAKIAKPTLIITGTGYNIYVLTVNSIIIAEKIQGSWLIQINDAGHAVMSQYPDKISKVLQTFLSIKPPTTK
jgi:pimeloyl-ACP methyl ester carboxylesterase